MSAEITLEHLIQEKGKEWGLRLMNRRILDASFVLRDRKIEHPSYLLAGFDQTIHPHRAYVLGELDVAFLHQLSPRHRGQALRRLFRQKPTAVFWVHATPPSRRVQDLARSFRVPLLYTPWEESHFIRELHRYLSWHLSPRTFLHASLVNVFGVGILLMGESGIGKTECALELVSRGHRLVADDLVEVVAYPEGALSGQSGTRLEAYRFAVEIRGLGVVNLLPLYGIRQFLRKSLIHLVIELARIQPDQNVHDRFAYERGTFELLRISLPHIRLPVQASKQLASIVETAALEYLHTHLHAPLSP